MEGEEGGRMGSLYDGERGAVFMVNAQKFPLDVEHSNKISTLGEHKDGEYDDTGDNRETTVNRKQHS